MRNYITLLAAAMVIALIPQSNARAEDIKEINAAVCQPYTSSIVDPALLKIRADGYTNNYTTSKFIICPIHRDGESNWEAPQGSQVLVYFRRASGTALTSDQCTLTLGWAAQSPVTTTTRNAVPLPTQMGPSTVNGRVLFDEADLANAAQDKTASVMCRVAPGHTLEMIRVLENLSS